MKYFERVIERMSFKFIPVISTNDNLIFGYKIMKDYSTMGFDDKEYMYQMAYEKSLFDDFSLKIFERACQEIIHKNLNNTYFFYTLRLNFLNDFKSFFKHIDGILKKYNLSYNYFIFDMKGIESWKNFHKEFSYNFKYKLILKEERNSNFNFNNIEHSKANFVEPRTLDTLIFMKENLKISQPLIFNLFYSQGIDSIFLKDLGINYYYNSDQ